MNLTAIAINACRKVITAIQKLSFCLSVSSTPVTFFQLIRNTKRFAWSPKSNGSRQQEKPAIYRMRLGKRPSNLYLRTFSGDLAIFYDIFWRRIYSLPYSVLQEAETIIDLGAHVGMTSLFFRTYCPQATLYAVEPDLNNYELLLKNLERDISAQKAIALHAAISDSTDPVYLQKAPLSYNSSITATPTLWQAPSISVEKLLYAYSIEKIDALKIDIEGAEHFLFDHDPQWLSITNNILIETHNEKNLQLFTAAVYRYGFVIERLSFENESVFWAYKPTNNR